MDARYRDVDRVRADQKARAPARDLAPQDPARQTGRRPCRVRQPAGRVEHGKNVGSRFSNKGFNTLLKRAHGDDALTSCVAMRRSKLQVEGEFAKADINSVVSEVTERIQVSAATRPISYAAAQVRVESMHRAGQLTAGKLRNSLRRVGSKKWLPRFPSCRTYRLRSSNGTCSTRRQRPCLFLLRRSASPRHAASWYWQPSGIAAPRRVSIRPCPRSTACASPLRSKSSTFTVCRPARPDLIDRLGLPFHRWIVAREHGLGEKLLGVHRPELADLVVCLDGPVDHFAVLFLFPAHIDIDDGISVIVKTQRTARRVAQRDGA